MCTYLSAQDLLVHEVTIKSATQQIFPDGTVRPFLITDPPLPSKIANTVSNSHDNDEIKVGDKYRIQHNPVEQTNYWTLLSSGTIDSDNEHSLDILVDTCPCCGTPLEFDDDNPRGYCLAEFCLARIILTLRLFIIAIGLRLTNMERAIMDNLVHKHIFNRTSDIFKLTIETLKYYLPKTSDIVLHALANKIASCKERLTVAIYLESLNIPRDNLWHLNPVGIDFNFPTIKEFLDWLYKQKDFVDTHYMSYSSFAKLRSFFALEHNRQTVHELILLGVL